MLINDKSLLLITSTLSSTKMKKNILSAIVVFFVTLAFLLVIDDISKETNKNTKESVKTYNTNQQSDIVVND